MLAIGDKSTKIYELKIISFSVRRGFHKIKKAAPGAGTPRTATVNRSQWSC